MTDDISDYTLGVSPIVGSDVKKVIPESVEGPNGLSSRRNTAKAQHPTTSQMVREAISSVNDRKGSSFTAINKYVLTNYLVDSNYGIYIKKYLKKAVESGELVQTKGKGVVGSFKLPPDVKVKRAVAKKTKSSEEKVSSGTSQGRTKKVPRNPAAVAEDTEATKKTKSSKEKEGSGGASQGRTKKAPRNQAAVAEDAEATKADNGETKLSKKAAVGNAELSKPGKEASITSKQPKPKAKASRKVTEAPKGTADKKTR